MIQPNYEYKVENLDYDDLDKMEKHLNFLGTQAWELISFDGEIAIFKRPQLYLISPYTSDEISKEKTN